MKNEISLYIHIPFCKNKCDYCDFYSEKIFSRKDTNTQSYLKKFLNAVIRDIKEQVIRYKVDNIPTVYIGGGTPSVLGSQVAILLDALKKLPVFMPKEFTIEANPESLTEEFLRVCKEGGVNRLSLGVQTFFEPSRKLVNRKGDKAGLRKALSLSKKYFQDNLSADLITGFPLQTKETVLYDIKKLLDYGIDHVSVYSLTLEKETALFKKTNTQMLSLPSNEESDELWFAAQDALLNAGFNHYEVSNFARKGCECRHNIRYWRMKSWLGAGPSASGTIIYEKTKTAKRFTYKPDAEKYLNGKCENEQMVIKCEQLLREIIMMGYRYYKGPDPKWQIEKYIPDTLEKWKDKNKMLFLNSFLQDAFKELEDFSHRHHKVPVIIGEKDIINQL